jgi:uncharacterized protein (UPF0332 family)
VAFDRAFRYSYNPHMINAEELHLAKAEEALAGAESEIANGRYNNCANRCYYGTFHAAIHAREIAGVSVASSQGTWSHEAVQAAFAGQLIQRRKLYHTDLRTVLLRNQTLRNTADYERHWVTALQASRALRRTRDFVAAVRSRGSAS